MFTQQWPHAPKRAHTVAYAYRRLLCCGSGWPARWLLAKRLAHPYASMGRQRLHSLVQRPGHIPNSTQAHSSRTGTTFSAGKSPQLYLCSPLATCSPPQVLPTDHPSTPHLVAHTPLQALLSVRHSSASPHLPHLLLDSHTGLHRRGR
jgi:hypothetical protein